MRIQQDELLEKQNWVILLNVLKLSLIFHCLFFSGFKHYLLIINVSCLKIKPDEFPQEAKLHINFTDCFKIKLNFSLADFSGLCVIYLFSLKQEKVVKEVRKINATRNILSVYKYI